MPKFFFIETDSHWFVAACGFLARTVTILARLPLIFVLLNYLGVDKYAICAVIVSLEGWFVLCDCGLGSAAQNFVSERRVKGVSIDPLLCSIMQLAAGLFLLFSLLFFFMAPFLSSFLFCKMGDPSQYTQALFCAGLFYTLGAMGAISYRLLYALQKGYWVHLFQTLGALLSFGVLLALTKGYLGKEKLLCSLLCLSALPALVSCGAFYSLFPLRRLFSSFDFAEIKVLFSKALQFGGFALSTALALGIDYMIMARTLSAEEILRYNVVSKMFTGFFVVHGTFLQAVWPVCSEMAIHGRFEALKKLILRYSWYSFAFMASVTGAIALFSPTLCSLFFSAQNLNLPLSLILLLGVYYASRVLCDLFATALQSMNQLKTLLITVPIQALVGCVCQTFFAQKWGVNGIILGLICSFAATVSWVLPFVFYQTIKKKQLALQGMQ